MKHSIFLWIFFLLIYIYVCAEDIPFNNEEYQKYRQAEQKLIDARPDLIALQEQHDNDIGILSGLAFLYQRQPGLPLGKECDPAQPLELALKIDPNDKPSLFQKTYLDVLRYDFRRSSDLESGIIRKIQNAMQRNTNAKIEQGSDFSRYFKEELQTERVQKRSNSARYEIQNPNQAIAKVKAALDQEAIELLESIRKAQSIDDNAGYHYMEAYVYILLGNTKNAIGELENGSQKQMTTYLNMQNKRMKNVLNDIDYPESMQSYIIDSRCPFEDFIRSWIWRKGLEQYTAEQEQQGNYQEAKRVYRLLERIAEQCQPEQARPMNLGALMRKKLITSQKGKR